MSTGNAAAVVVFAQVTGAVLSGSAEAVFSRELFCSRQERVTASSKLSQDSAEK